eukprot:TRINITY_DN62469_c0_g1_i1.p1 TRINITY_DN62469_c0_g1~~TRINITY_DN62469_c0_g1_i1.p1  ORF type:complete len:302 (-),score=54.08 TRINITY_DN62469_c0_g1_i1:29-934(-)
MDPGMRLFLAGVAERLGEGPDSLYPYETLLVERGLQRPEAFLDMLPHQLITLGLPAAVATAIIDSAVELQEVLYGSDWKALPQNSQVSEHDHLLDECRDLLCREPPGQQLLLSMLRIALSKRSREYLRGSSLHHFLAQFPCEFCIVGPVNSAKVSLVDDEQSKLDAAAPLPSAPCRCASETAPNLIHLRLPVHNPDDWKDRVLIDGVIVEELKRRDRLGLGPWSLREMEAAFSFSPEDMRELLQEAFFDADVRDLPAFLKKYPSRVKLLQTGRGDTLVQLVARVKAAATVGDGYPDPRNAA